MACYALALLILAQGETVEAVSTEDPVLIAAALNAAYERWLAEIEFRADYVLEKGFSTDESQVWDGIIERRTVWEDGVPFVCRGVFVKSREALRVSGDYGAPPLRRANDRTTRVGFDEIRTREVRATHLPAGVRSADDSSRRGSLIVTSRPGGEVNLADQYAAGPVSRSQLGPLSIHGGEIQFPCVINSKAGVPIDTHVHIISPERLEVTLERTGRSTRRRVVVWRTDFSPPVVESIRETFDWPERNQRTITLGCARNFVLCRGGAVASQIVFANWEGDHPDRWQIRRWSSDNITSDLSETELTLEIPPSTLIGGLSVPTNSGATTTIDFSRLSRQDVLDPRTPITSSGPEMPRTPHHALWPRWVWILNAAAVAAFGLVYLFMHWRSKSAE